MSITDKPLAPGQSARTDLTEGDHCHDTDSPHGVLVVVEVTGVRASAYELTGGISVGMVHDEYPPTDCVIIAAYERNLDRHCDYWRETEVTADQLKKMGVDLYYYPESKLEVYDAGNYTDREDECVCEHCKETVDSTTAWVEHVVRECQQV